VQVDYDDSTQVHETIVIKVFATQPSPWDSAHGPFADSISLDGEVPVGGEFPGIETEVFNAGIGVGGIGIAYAPNVNPPAVFSLAYSAFPMIYSDFLLNHTYTDTTTAVAFVTTMVNGNGPGRYFTSTVPADGSSAPTTTTYYSQANFTRKFTSTQLGNYDTTYFASGVISGHELLSFGTSDPNKYVQRWDFTVTFNNLTYSILP
jgi:hypothetical protein